MKTSLFRLRSLPVAFLLFLMGLPTALGQLPTTTLQVEADPKGSWNEDGYLAAEIETATWTAQATITFSQTSACTEDTTVTFELQDATGHVEAATASGPQAIDVPPGGGTVYANATAGFSLKRPAPAGHVQSARLHVVVAPCPVPTGTQKGAETNLTLEVVPLFFPLLQIAFKQVFSYEGTFNATLRNEGNGPLRVEIHVEPVEASPEQNVDVPESLRLGVQESKTLTLQFPENHLTGFYNVRFDGTFDGLNGDVQPRTQFVQPISVLVPQRVIEELPESAPQLDSFGLVLGLLGSLALTFRTRTPRHRRRAKV